MGAPLFLGLTFLSLSGSTLPSTPAVALPSGWVAQMWMIRRVGHVPQTALGGCWARPRLSGRTLRPRLGGDGAAPRGGWHPRAGLLVPPQPQALGSGGQEGRQEAGEGALPRLVSPEPPGLQAAGRGSGCSGDG